MAQSNKYSNDDDDTNMHSWDAQSAPLQNMWDRDGGKIHENCYPLVIVFVLKLLITLKPDKNLMVAMPVSAHTFSHQMPCENRRKKKRQH